VDLFSKEKISKEVDKKIRKNKKRKKEVSGEAR